MGMFGKGSGIVVGIILIAAGALLQSRIIEALLDLMGWIIIIIGVSAGGRIYRIRLALPASRSCIACPSGSRTIIDLSCGPSRITLGDTNQYPSARRFLAE